MTNPIFWANLAARFRAIPDADPRNPLEAHWCSAGWGDWGDWLIGDPTESEREGGGWGDWLLRGGPTESERDLFKNVARMGAVALGHP